MSSSSFSALVNLVTELIAPFKAVLVCLICTFSLALSAFPALAVTNPSFSLLFNCVLCCLRLAKSAVKRSILCSCRTFLNRQPYLSLSPPLLLEQI